MPAEQTSPTPASLSAWIDDGCTRAGFIAERERLHPPLRFWWRPLLVQSRSEIRDRLAAEREAKSRDLIAARVLVDQLVEWRVVDRQGRPVPISVPHVLRLDPNLFDTLFQIVLGRRPSDADPHWTAATAEQHVLEAASVAWEQLPHEEFTTREESAREKN